MGANDILQHIAFSISGTALFFGLYLMRSYHIRSVFWRGCLHLALSFHFANILFLSHDMVMPNFGLAFGLLYGPILLLYIKSHTAFRPYGTLHLLPGLLLMVWIMVTDMMGINTADSELLILTILVYGHFIHYLVLSYKWSKTVGRNTLTYRSNRIIDDSIKVVKHTVLIISILYLVGLFELIPSSYLSIEQLQWMTLFACLFLLLALFRSITTYLNPFHEKLGQGISPIELNDSAPTKYQSSNLTEEIAKDHVAKLNIIMLEIKPFQEFDLTLGKLSKLTEISERHLSQVINEQFGQNFYDFINSKRIEEAKSLLMDETMRISEIMYDVGFVSRSSFNTAFKKYVGMTPSDYRRNNISDNRGSS